MRFRSLLFCPGNRPEMVAKLARAHADAVVIDLEDGVPAGDKDAARPIARQAAADLLAAHPDTKAYVRLNATGTPWIEADIATGLAPGVAGVVLPKLETATDLGWVAARLDAAGFPAATIIGGLESAAGVEAAPQLAHDRLAAVYFGAEDYVTDVGGERTAAGTEALYARSRVVMAARILGVPAIDQVVVDIKNDERFLAEADDARSLGYAGKLCLHPAQVVLANQAFTPNEHQIDRARRLLIAARQAGRQGRGVIVFEGQMVDQPAISQAEQVLERAGMAGDIHEEDPQ